MNNFKVLNVENNTLISRNDILTHYKELYPDELSVKLGFTYADLDFIRRERHSSLYNNNDEPLFATFNTEELNAIVVSLTSLTKGFRCPVINASLRDSGAFNIIIEQLITYYTIVNDNIKSIYDDNIDDLTSESQERLTRRMQKLDYQNIQKLDILNNLI